MLKIAHRGASGYSKENTLIAFQKALDLGADMIELDVRRSYDNKLIVIHDDKVANLTLAKIRQTNWGQDVPTLQQALALLKNQALIDIELKESATLDPAVTIVKKMGMEKQVLFTSFDYQTMIKLKQIYPALIAGFILGNQEKKIMSHLLSQAIKYHLEILVVRHNLITKQFIKQARLSQLKIYAWTVNTKKTISRLVKLGTDGIITDHLRLFY